MNMILRADKIPNCIQDLDWFHPLIDDVKLAEGLLLSFQPGSYLLRSSDQFDHYTLSVRTKSDIKHYRIIVEGEKITFGMANFKNFRDFENHFKKRPLIEGLSGDMVVLNFPVKVEKHKTVHEIIKLHSLQSPNSSKELSSKTGYLTKQGGFVKTWKERWFVLDERTLCYYSNKEMSELKGIVDIRNCNQVREVMGTKDNRDFLFELVTPWRVFLFSASSMQEKQEWISVLRDKIFQIKKIQRTFSET